MHGFAPLKQKSFKTNSRNIILFLSYRGLPLYTELLTASSCHAARKPDCRIASGTHIKAVDKRKRALIVRRSSIHEAGGYGYTYVLRCTYTTCWAGLCRARAHARGLSRV